MNDSSLEKTSPLNSIQSAPRRPQKQGSVQSIVKNESDKNVPSPFEEITLSDDDEETMTKSVKCPSCSRDMTIWTSSRRDIHTKVCKAREQEKKQATKRRSLTQTIEKDDKVLDKPTHEFREPQKSWELSKNNVRFARIAADDEENRKRKRPRSFAVVELAPKKCQCEVLTTLHSRFIDEFHCKSIEGAEKKEKGVTEHAYQMKRIIGKLSRFEQLSADMQKLLDDTSELSPSIVTFKTSDGFHVKSQSLILKHRTSVIRMHPKTEMINIDQSREVLKVWLNFVFTANIEWSDVEKEGVKELAVKYGPVGLENLLKEEKRVETQKEESPKKESSLMHSEKQSDDDEVEVLEQKDESKIEETVEPEDRPESPVDCFTSDDPFYGFGKADYEEKDSEGDQNDKAIIIDSPSKSSFTATPSQKSKDNITMDSFDEWSNQPSSSSVLCASSTAYSTPSKSTPAKASPAKISPLKTVTPVRNVPKPVFGSHIKILKTNDVTPMPSFDTMDEAELKERMKEIGMRPKGKKAMIQILKKAYTTLHPEICTGTPTIRPLIRIESENVSKEGKTGKAQKTKTLSERIAAFPRKTASKNTTPKKLPDPIHDSPDDTDADKTLNISNDEREAGKICGDDIGGDDDDDEEEVASSSSSSGKSDLNALKSSFLTWLRDEQNSVLHEHILSLQPVSLEEMLIRLEKAEGPLGRIAKGKLVKILEMLKITYQLPQTGKTGRARGGFKRRL
ncbi:CBN-HIM-18 protein [Caenorhabditis brenneri]|uniref:CBN-HIM-18 protein n=1 Tax=Caenorhabditis brenneri TaxID=135651 RepID=G0MEE3_CAEBE|nr:CBN-HIM-18 protein [Caenorhabditis brenneri]